MKPIPLPDMDSLIRQGVVSFKPVVVVRVNIRRPELAGIRGGTTAYRAAYARLRRRNFYSRGLTARGAPRKNIL